MSDLYWRAVCDKCGAVERETAHHWTLNPWFLPSRCRKCGDHKDRHAGTHQSAGWAVQFGRDEPSVTLVWWKPWTWISRVRFVELEEHTNG